MRVDAVREFLERHGLGAAYRQFEVSSATVDLAAAAVGCEPGRIAKTLSLLGKDGPLVLVVMGTARLDNRKFKDVFHQKAHFIKAEDVESLVGHPMGGVCPFALPEGVPVYLDVSMRRFDTVYPAAGSANSAVPMTCQELSQCARAAAWVDVGKAWAGCPDA